LTAISSFKESPTVTVQRAGTAAVFNGDISLFVSGPIIREVRDVLNRAELRRKLPGIDDRVVNAFLTKLGGKGDSPR
jgi:hypothetical protein